MGVEHLQSDKPLLTWDNWLRELAEVYAKAERIPDYMAFAGINQDEARKWYEQGFTPYTCFRETYNQ